MSAEISHDLRSLKLDQWFEQALDESPPLRQLCALMGDALVALASAVGLRIQSAKSDTAGRVTQLTWSSEQSPDSQRSGDVLELRAELLAALLAEPHSAVPSADAGARAWAEHAVGRSFLKLSPLFGLELRTLLVNDDEPRLVVSHDNVEETVPVRMFRRFLRARVMEAMQGDAGRQVAIDLRQVELARAALSEGRLAEVVSRLGAWVNPLMMYIRTPEGASLDPHARAELGRALATLAEAYFRLGRFDESGESMRLGIQYAYESPVAPVLYLAHATMLMAQSRFDEAIGPLRRAHALTGDSSEVLLLLGNCYIETRRYVAALGCARTARRLGAELSRCDELDARVAEKLGAALVRYDALLRDDRKTERPPSMRVESSAFEDEELERDTSRPT